MYVYYTLHIYVYIYIYIYIGSWDSAVYIATGYGLGEREVGVQVPVWAKFSLPHNVQTGSRAHPASYLMSTGGLFPLGKTTGA
jgi:hypothetical protein